MCVFVDVLTYRQSNKYRLIFRHHVNNSETLAKTPIGRCTLAIDSRIFVFSICLRRRIQFLTIPQRLASVKTKSAGRLYGIANNGTLLLGFSLADSIESNLPFYVKDVGRIQWTDGSASDTDDNVCSTRETSISAAACDSAAPFSSLHKFLSDRAMTASC